MNKSLFENDHKKSLDISIGIELCIKTVDL